MDKTLSSKQSKTNTLFLRENRNQNASNFLNTICISVAWID